MDKYEIEIIKELLNALQYYSDEGNICLYDDIDWSDNFICERNYKNNSLNKVGKKARTVFEKYKHYMG